MDDAQAAEPMAAESPLSEPARTWKAAALEPRRFFGALPAQAPLGPALLYYLAIGIAVAGAQLFWSMVYRATGFGGGGLFGIIDSEATWGPLVDFLLAPVVLLVSLFLSAGVSHLLLRLLGGASRDYGFTVRVFAFAYSPQLLGVVPFVGQVVGFVWMIVIAIVGLGAGHRTSTGRAAAAVLVPVVVGLVFVMIAAFIAATGSLLITG